jgi:hypothetical protein
MLAAVPICNSFVRLPLCVSGCCAYACDTSHLCVSGRCAHAYVTYTLCVSGCCAHACVTYAMHYAYCMHHARAHTCVRLRLSLFLTCVPVYVPAHD